MKILWVTNIPSPYRVDFFNELGKYCDLTVIFERSSSSERDKSWEQYKFSTFNGVILQGIGIGVDKAISLKVLKFLGHDSYDHVVISNPLTLTGAICIEYLRMKKRAYFIESDGGIPKEGKGLRERLKRHVLKEANLYFSTASIHDKYYLTYGARKKDIVRYPFTSLRESNILEKILSSEEKEKLRSKLGMKENKIILSVGRFVYGKGYDILLKAASQLDKDIGIYIVGGTPTDDYLKQKSLLGLTNVHFEEFKAKEVLSNYFMSADLFVLPTRGDVWGLVVNEAMAYGLPVITTDKCVAGLELVRNYENGFIVPVDDADSLARRMNKVLNDNVLCSNMSNKSLEVIKGFTIEKMVEKHLEVFSQYINSKY